MAASRIAMPVSSVRANCSPSLRSTSRTNACFATSSGYAAPMTFASVGTSSLKNAGLTPNLCPWRIARRAMRRST